MRRVGRSFIDERVLYYCVIWLMAVLNVLVGQMHTGDNIRAAAESERALTIGDMLCHQLLIF